MTDAPDMIPRPQITLTDCAVVGLALGAAIAFGRFTAPAPARANAPAIVREYLTQQVWAPQCAPNYRGKTVEAMPAPALGMDTFATAESGDGSETRRSNGENAPTGRARKTPYERARDAAEFKYYRDMLKGR